MEAMVLVGWESVLLRRAAKYAFAMGTEHGAKSAVARPDRGIEVKEAAARIVAVSRTSWIDEVK